MKYQCNWTDLHGVKHDEGSFRVATENENMYELERVTTGAGSKYPDVQTVVLPKEGKHRVGSFVSNPQYWQDSIQVHLGTFPFAFCFEVIK